MKLPIFSATANSLVKKHLSDDIFKPLEHEKTDSGFTLAHAIRSGIVNPDSAIGIYAGDAQTYETFSLLFDPIIREYHGFSKSHVHVQDFSHLSLPMIDPEKKYILSTRIRVARNLNGFNFPCHMSLTQRRELEKKIIFALNRLKGSLSGRYIPFEGIDEKDFQYLKNKNIWFEKGDRFQEAAGINSDFPRCRGVFHSLDSHFVVWVNEEDHLRIISMEHTSDLSSVYNRLCLAFEEVSRHLDFASSPRYGFLTSCPTNIGTSMRAGVHIRLEKLEQKKDLLDVLAGRYNLQIRGTSGEKTKVENAVFDISNRQRLGISETDIVKTLHNGLQAIIKSEKGL